jgi:RimJ/RimL family protein N-acetyltransferase
VLHPACLPLCCHRPALTESVRLVPVHTRDDGESVVAVRRLRADEWERYREVRLAALRDAPYAFGSTWAEESTRPAERWQQRAAAGAAGVDSAGVIAEALPSGSERRWVGLAGGYRPGEGAADAELVSMWVAPHVRGHRLAARLARSVIEWAAEPGAALVGLWVSDGNTAAMRAYRALGFAFTGERQPLPSNASAMERRMLLALHNCVAPTGAGG